MEQESLPPPPIPQQRLLLTPSDIPADPDGGLPWWKPTWRDVASRLGWRWLYLIPSILIAFAFIVLIVVRLSYLRLLLYGGKLWLYLGAAAVAAVAQAMRQATSARSDPFCIHCGYTLAGLPDQHICPECGRPYSFSLIRQYQQDPRWFVQRWKAQHANPRSIPFEAGKVVGGASRDGT